MPETLIDSVTASLLDQDKKLLEATQFPIVTLSASFRDKVENQYDLEDGRNHPDVVFSRAHYSMALAVAEAAWGPQTAQPQSSPSQTNANPQRARHANPKRAWLVDPTNYVQKDDWSKASSMEKVGRILARNPLLNWVKQNVADRYLRSRLPITSAIQGPLLYLFENVRRPIISLHVETGNMLAQAGKTVVQVVTDPHVREDYLNQAHLPNISFCVFDEATKKEFLEKADLLNKKISEKRVFVTGSPVDPRVVAARKGAGTSNHKNKHPTAWRTRGLRLLLTTGGLGTNKDELERAVKSLLPALERQRAHHLPVSILYYAGTNLDHKKMVQSIAKKAGIPVSSPANENGRLRVLYADDLVDANLLLLRYGFPWADIVVTKPSGDMAYDAVAAGCPVLFLEPWGEWEKVIARNFLKLGVAQWAKADALSAQITELAVSEGSGASAKTSDQESQKSQKSQQSSQPWIQQAIETVLEMPLTEFAGAKRILETAKKVG